MFFLRSVALLWCATHVLSKPFNAHAPIIVPRQDSASLSEEQTVCGDIIIAAQQGKATEYDKAYIANLV
jgi:hypothetical protein